jgi:C-terminal processing protease CtpA/Prc
VKRFAEFSPRIESTTSPRQFAEAAAELLAPARDTHLWLKVGNETIPTFRRIAPWNVARRSLPQRVPQWRNHNAIISSGVFEDRIRYLFIASWPADASQVAPAFDIIKDAAKAGQQLIVDVRANGGGSETTARQVAGCFVAQPVAYAKHTTRANGKFGEPQTRYLQPNPNQPLFTNRVVLLAGQGTLSSSESFVLMMKQNPRCTFVGESTAGSSGNPQPVDLGNGVTAFIPSWRDLGLNGTPLEGVGVKPDVEIKTAPEDFRDADPVIAAALKILRSPKKAG